jgi:hypothetical protein
MEFKLIHMKRCLALVGFVGIILLMGAFLQLKKAPAATSHSHFTAPELTYTRMDLPQPARKGGFLDDINISFDPPAKIQDSDPYHASLDLQRDLPSGSFARLPPRPGDATNPALTVVDRKLNYELFDSEGFALKVNLEPAYPYPEALIPTRLDPGFGVSIKF